MSSPGDVLGVESCIDLRANHETNNLFTTQYNNHYSGGTGRCSGGHRSFTPAKAMKKAKYDYREYPPPLPSLGMEMRRYCTGDGRLIIREEKMSRPMHDVFRADRSNGRLTLHFVRFEDHGKNDVVLDRDDGVFQMDDVDDEVVVVASSVNKLGLVEQKRVMA